MSQKPSELALDESEFQQITGSKCWIHRFQAYKTWKSIIGYRCEKCFVRKVELIKGAKCDMDQYEDAVKWAKLRVY